ncbi:hypothetical protein ACOMHN_048863 [Nucella lapillus]
MATSFKETASVNALNFETTGTDDSRYWENLEQPVTKKEFGHVTNIDFSPVAPNHFAVTSSARVQIYSSKSNELVRRLNQFTKSASSGNFRSDGKLFVAGDEKKIKIFDPTARSLMRNLSGHTDSVLVTKFLADKQSIMSASKDTTVRLWDIATQGETSCYREFKDYVKCGVTSVSSSDIILAGSYDHTAKLFDRRADQSVLTVDHGCPIESVLMFPSNGIFMTAGGTVVKVWDALAGGRQLSQLSHHHKTVMALCLCRNNRQFMSAGSDRHIKIYDVGSYQVVHTLDYPANILSVAVAPDDNVVVVGMEGGLLSIRHRKKDATKALKRKTPAQTFRALPDDLVVSNQKKPKLERYDRLLKSFKVSKALDAALEPHIRQMTPEKTLGVILELKRRGALKSALAGRTTQQLQPLLKYIQKNIWKPNFRHLLDVLNIVMDLYEEEGASNPALQTSLKAIKMVMEADSHDQRELMAMKGSLDTFFASAADS